MPVIFSEEQREQIRRQIKEQAKELFSQKSVRKTSVSELAESVGIAKGTFYHFYASKGALVAEIIDDYNAVSVEALWQMLEKKGKIPLEEFADFYKSAFRPESSFAYHFSPDDIKWMTETEETKHFFNAEDSIRLAQLILSYADGIRPDVDYAYIVNFAKLINLAIENRAAFCAEAFDKNLDAIFGMMLAYLKGE